MLISCLPRYIPAFWNSLAPASLPKVDEEKEEDAEKLGKSSSEKYLFRSGPTPNPNAFPSVVDLSATVFQDEPFKKPKPSKKKTET